MFKQISLSLAAIVLLLASCSIKEDRIHCTAPVNVRVSDFSISLPMGSYSMVVLGYGLNDGEPPITLTSPISATFGDYPARETFAATQPVNITNADAVNIDATLNRIVSKLQVASSDVRTTNAASVKMTFLKGSKSFNPTTGLATDNTGFSSEHNTAF